VQLGCGGISTDYLATVASFPNPDDKIRSLALKVQGGGNVGNALTAAAHLGLAPRVISKVRPFSFSLFPPQFFLTKSPRLVVVASNDKSSQFESYLDQVSNDSMGRIILQELQSDGVDASYMVVCITFPYLNSTVIVTQ
jgi:sugar/nucleoside kinase (ribokinase family)